MIDEHVLEQLLSTAGDHIEVPAAGLADVLTAAASRSDEPEPGPRWSSRRLRLGLAVAAAAVAVAVAVATDPWSAERPTVALNKSPEVAADVPASPSPPMAGGSVAGGAGAALGTASGVGGPPAAPVPQAAQPVRVIKTGDIRLVVPRARFEPTITQLTTMAAGAGGFVAQSNTTTNASVPAGSITLRVPAASFETTLNQVRALGKVTAVNTKGEDVTAQYVNLQARIDALSAARQRYVTLLSRASAVGDILAVQQRIDDLQSQLEQLQGQQRVNDDQTQFATLAVAVSEDGSAADPPKERKPSRWSKAWQRATDGFLAGVQGVISASGVVAFILLCATVLGGVAWLTWRRFHRRIV